MATLDRIEPAYTPWTPSSTGIGAVDDDVDYVGRHRRPSSRALSVRRMFYTARHRRR